MKPYTKIRRMFERKEEQVYESMTELVIELQHYESKVESAKSSAEALHAATEGLKPLNKANMMKSADLETDARALQSTQRQQTEG